ncbi:ArgE/DapE family deacylase [Peptoniphilus sp. KCTC 25270]|uniref:ArgE/DapE family deacylase n=1 Tax=Peptoniphilus sp. KCTC 25270 TaxID=2897414 RepID=UPI001E3BD393|nr:ArgE/DapE family deacylase [Peptoniphilus sp. KCTC 25270]MCD1146508.1 ArgE/DapE family deacylase [Peptoniphilus sp. KCTC 25270]
MDIIIDINTSCCIKEEVIDKNEKIKLLQDMIQIKTVNTNEKELANYLKIFLKSKGIESELIDYNDERSSLVVEVSNGERKTLVLSGHMDVVEAGDENLWTYPPFSGHIDGDVIWGRGTSDMKSGLAAMVIALVEANEKKNFNGTIRLLATVGEEVGQFGAEQLEEKSYMKNVDGLLIGEPCNIGIVYAHKGSLNYEVISKGMAAHSSTPELGVKAIENLLLASEKITKQAKDWNEQIKNDSLGNFDHNITIIGGGLQVNSIPDQAYLEANARTIPELENDKIIARIQEIIDELNKKEGVDLELRVTSSLPPVEANPNSDLVKIIANIANNSPELSIDALLKSMGDTLAKT